MALNVVARSTAYTDSRPAALYWSVMARLTSRLASLTWVIDNWANRQRGLAMTGWCHSHGRWLSDPSRLVNGQKAR